MRRRDLSAPPRRKVRGPGWWRGYPPRTRRRGFRSRSTTHRSSTPPVSTPTAPRSRYRGRAWRRRSRWGRFRPALLGSGPSGSACATRRGVPSGSHARRSGWTSRCRAARAAEGGRWASARSVAHACAGRRSAFTRRPSGPRGAARWPGWASAPTFAWRPRAPRRAPRSPSRTGGAQAEATARDFRSTSHSEGTPAFGSGGRRCPPPRASRSRSAPAHGTSPWDGSRTPKDPRSHPRRFPSIVASATGAARTYFSRINFLAALKPGARRR